MISFCCSALQAACYTTHLPACFALMTRANVSHEAQQRLHLSYPLLVDCSSSWSLWEIVFCEFACTSQVITNGQVASSQSTAHTTFTKLMLHVSLEDDVQHSVPASK